MKNTVIIIDDDIASIQYYQNILEKYGYKTIEFTSPLNAYRFLINFPRVQDKIFCIITALRFKDQWSGYDMASSLNLLNIKIPIIAISEDIHDYDSIRDFSKLFISYHDKNEINVSQIYKDLLLIEKEFYYDIKETV